MVLQMKILPNDAQRLHKALPDLHCIAIHTQVHIVHVVLVQSMDPLGELMVLKANKGFDFGEGVASALLIDGSIISLDLIVPLSDFVIEDVLFWQVELLAVVFDEFQQVLEVQ
jgi:hypothetical protein